MVFLMKEECRCCQKFVRTGDIFHCKFCWNRHHNGLTDLDWEDEETFRANHANGGIVDINKIIKEIIVTRAKNEL